MRSFILLGMFAVVYALPSPKGGVGKAFVASLPDTLVRRSASSESTVTLVKRDSQGIGKTPFVAKLNHFW